MNTKQPTVNKMKNQIETNDKMQTYKRSQTQKFRIGGLAQSVERWIPNPKVKCSIHLVLTFFFSLGDFFCFH
jgi:hypothetical protein